ncbi:hypothetical protein PROFUN_02490 [Planoprotostelium fungivorum]|uniref:SsuA/THI5-like domain-containing protein n=1 Tax=Planoprotostelium fungivorum TaxID=1890364 RepID=A0A2P6MP57_9EUKA|nr:hypothetical protein PROFUN_02490 [Planoprotostelium fungivorum]
MRGWREVGTEAVSYDDMRRLLSDNLSVFLPLLFSVFWIFMGPDKAAKYECGIHRRMRTQVVVRIADCEKVNVVASEDVDVSDVDIETFCDSPQNFVSHAAMLSRALSFVEQQSTRNCNFLRVAIILTNPQREGHTSLVPILYYHQPATNIMARFVLFLSLFALALSQTCDVRVGIFSKVGTLSIAKQQNFFATAGLNNGVCVVNVPNSLAAYQYLANGTIDILQGAIDNTLNRVFNRQQNVTALALTDLGPDYIIAGANGVNSIADLKGKSLIVDAVNSGFAYLIQSILLSNGLTLNVDYTFVPVGSTPLRYAALLSGKTTSNQTVYASLLTYPFTGNLVFANRPDIKILARSSDYIYAYAASAVNVQTTNLADPVKVELYTKYLTAYVLTAHFIANPDNQAAIVQDLAKDLNVTTAVAQYQYSAILDKRTGDAAVPDLIAPPIAVLATSNLRQQFGGYSFVANFSTAGLPKQQGGPIFDYTILNQSKLRAAAIEAQLNCPFVVTQAFTASYASFSGTTSVYSVTITNKSSAAAGFSLELPASQKDKLIWQIGLTANGYQSNTNTYKYSPIILNLTGKVAAGGKYQFDYGSNNGLLNFAVDGC